MSCPDGNSASFVGHIPNSSRRPARIANVSSQLRQCPCIFFYDQPREVLEEPYFNDTIRQCNNNLARGTLHRQPLMKAGRRSIEGAMFFITPKT